MKRQAPIRADQANDLSVIKEWFPTRHEDEVHIASASSPDERRRLIGQAILRRENLWHHAYYLDDLSRTNEGDEFYSDLGQGDVLYGKDRHAIAGDLARFIGKYGHEVVGEKGISHLGQYYESFLRQSNDNPAVVSEIIKNPETFGKFFLAKNGWKDPLAEGEPIDNQTFFGKDKIPLRGLSHPAAAIAKAIDWVPHDAVKSNPEYSKVLLDIYKKYRGQLAEDTDDYNAGKEAAFKEGKVPRQDMDSLLSRVHPDLVPTSLESEYAARAKDFKFWESRKEMSKPSLIKKVVSNLAAYRSKYGNDSPGKLVASFFNENPHTTIKQWMEYQHELPAETENNVKYPVIPDRFMDDDASFKKLVQKWPWDQWHFANHGDSFGSKRSYDHMLYRLRDLDPALLKQVSQKLRSMPASWKDYKGTPIVPNDHVAEFADLFDDKGEYLPVNLHDKKSTRAQRNWGSDPNINKVRTAVRQAMSNLYQDESGSSDGFQSAASYATDPAFMRKMSPDIAQSLYGAAQHFVRNFASERGAKEIDLNRAFANTFLSHPEYNSLDRASKFWNDYESEVKQSHFPVAQAAAVGEHKAHVPFRKRRSEKGMLNENGEEVFTSQGTEDLWPSLRGHAKLSQAALIRRYLNDKNADFKPQSRVKNNYETPPPLSPSVSKEYNKIESQAFPDEPNVPASALSDEFRQLIADKHHPVHAPKFKVVNGKLHVKVYRGIAGEHGADIHNHLKEGGDLDVAGIQSFSLDPTTAAWFAKNRQADFDDTFLQQQGTSLSAHMLKHFPHLEADAFWKHKMPSIRGRPYVVEGWLPVEDIMHFGAVSRDIDALGSVSPHSGFKPQHGDEQELVFLSRNNKLPHGNFRIHDANKFVKKYKLMRNYDFGGDKPSKAIPRGSDMPVTKTDFADLINIMHGSPETKVPKKVAEAAVMENPEKKENPYAFPDTVSKPSVVQHKGIPIMTSEPEAKTAEKPRDPTRSRHTIKKSEGESDE